MKVKQIIAAIFFATEALVLAQEFPLGIRAQALGGATVARGRDAEALFENPALLAVMPKRNLTVFYSHPFGLKELRLSSVAGTARWKHLSFGAALVDFGNDFYHDRRYHLVISHHLSSAPRLALGLGSTIRHLRISGYGADSAMLFNFGTQLRLSESLALGSAFGNLLNATIGRQQEKLPSSACFGLAYSPAANVALQMDLYKESHFSEEWRIGIEASPLPALLLRVGVGTNPDRLTFGFSLRILKASLQFTTFSHTDLGWTQQFAVTLD